MTKPDPLRRRPGRPAHGARDTDDPRAAILHAAETEFGERGFDGASVSSIAKRAGVAQPLINYHFSSKARLWETVIEDIYVALEPALTVPAADGMGAQEAFRHRVRNFVLFSAARPSLALIIASELRQPGPRLTFLRQKYISRLERETIRQVKDGYGFNPRDKRLKLLFPLILSSCAGPFLHQSYLMEAHNLDPTSPKMAAAYADMAVTMIEAGLETLAAAT